MDGAEQPPLKIGKDEPAMNVQSKLVISHGMSSHFFYKVVCNATHMLQALLPCADASTAELTK
eukprot:scaffold32823_cov19-Tisochrysis_lutea.AAC.2